MTTEQLSALENQLREKEQLVSALTERLEQAAEQLDRIRRSGGDRGMRGGGGGGGMPPELVEEQRTAVTELQQAVQEWSAMQPGATLGRIEVQILELRDLVARKLPDGSFDGATHGSYAAHSDHSQADRGRSPSQSKNASGSAYETMKAQLLDSQPESRRPAEPAAKPVAPAPATPKEEIAPVDPPDLIDLESAGADDLRKAVEQRDAYISFLTRKLRAAEMCYQESIDWETLNNAPEDLKRRLEDLEKTLHATLRHAEIDHSLERARLGREAMRLEQQEELIRRELKRLNISDKKDAAYDELEAEPANQESGANSRWQRLFGKK